MAGSADEITIDITSEPTLDDVRALEQGLSAHARAFVTRPGFQPLAVLARDGTGRLVGGVVARVNWSWLHVSLVWVAEELRGSGIGALLLAAAEDTARARGCTRAHLDTFSYQARPFYEKRGWRVFATLDDYPEGHQRFFLRKDL
ncbi:MAG: GNAT family N-acetyltransferase [Deltaproteobacteria bacterium]|nr:GNAT family N-acetyltransferase [Deltaproteobacteria bacterium]